MPTPSAPYTVLLVDDVPSVRESLRLLLQFEDDLAVIGEAGDGPAALRLAGERSPDLVILDIELPGLDGYAVTRSLKRLPRPPLVILLSVHGDRLSRQRGIEAGSDGFIEKGADWPATVAHIRRALADRLARRENR
jgi:DNA-binding NarL/FixJ family response regulator